MKYLDQIARYRWEGLFLFSLLFPFLCGFDKYLMHVAITISLNVAMATSMWLIWTLGLISFAHGGIMGIPQLKQRRAGDLHTASVSL